MSDHLLCTVLYFILTADKLIRIKVLAYGDNVSGSEELKENGINKV